MSRVCLVIYAVLSTLVGFFAYKYYAVQEDFAAYRHKAVEDVARANDKAFQLLQAQQQAYTKALLDKQYYERQLSSLYNSTLTAIERRKEVDREFKTWADTELPPIVVERLRQLPSARSKDESSRKLPASTGG